MSLLEVTGVESGYGKLPVLHGVSLHVDENEIVAVFGPNGAGKSTLMHTVFGLLPLMKGAVTFDGEDLGQIPAEGIEGRGMAYVPQESNTFPALTVEENLKIGLFGGEPSSMRAAIGQGLETFPALQVRRRQRAGTLSGGERQMLALACAIVLAPRLLVLDEPTSGLAPILVDTIIAHALDFAKAGTTILWVVGDDTTKILKHANRAYMLQSGVIEGEWAADELHDEKALAELYFGGASRASGPSQQS